MPVFGYTFNAAARDVSALAGVYVFAAGCLRRSSNSGCSYIVRPQTDCTLIPELARLQRDLEEITRLVNDTITERDALRKELTKVSEERQLWYERAIRLGSDYV